MTRSRNSLGQHIAPATTFTPFASLPLEVQVGIWEFGCEDYARSNARVQTVAKDRRPKRPDEKPPSEPAELRILAPQRWPVPPILHVCQAARAVGSRHWTRFPGADVNRPCKRDGTFIYVNKEHDTIYFADGLLEDFLFLRCIDWAAPLDSGLPKTEFNDAYDEFCKLLEGVKHYALDFWTWLAEVVKAGCLWMSFLCIAGNEDLTIVIHPLSPDIDAAAAPLSYVPIMKEITPGTTRAETVDLMLHHIKDSADYSEGAKPRDPRDTQLLKRGWEASEEPYKEYMPNLKALAVIRQPGYQEDDENGAKDKAYLERVRNQCRYHRLKASLESMSYEQHNLRIQMKEDETPFPDFTIRMMGGIRYE